MTCIEQGRGDCREHCDECEVQAKARICDSPGATRGSDNDAELPGTAHDRESRLKLHWSVAASCKQNCARYESRGCTTIGSPGDTTCRRRVGDVLTDPSVRTRTIWGYAERLSRVERTAPRYAPCTGKRRHLVSPGRFWAPEVTAPIAHTETRGTHGCEHDSHKHTAEIWVNNPA